MGNGADLVLNKLNQLHIPVAGVFASNGFVRQKCFHEMPVTDYQTAKKQFGAMTVLLCFGTDRPDVRKNIEQIALENELLIPDVPVCGSHYFDREFYDKHREEINRAACLLHDRQSVLCFRELLAFKADGDRQHLLRCESEKEEAVQQILHYNSHEIYMDLGAFNGDTVLQFSAAVPNYEKIYAAEPSPKSFAKLKQNTKHLHHTEYRNAAAYSCDTTLPFSTKGGRGSTTAGTGSIAACTVDSWLNGRPVTVLKMDIEGDESAAIEGAAQTIAHFKPKLQIAAYHRTEDLFALPLQILKIRPDYRVYLRHFPCYPAWDTNYYFI